MEFPFSVKSKWLPLLLWPTYGLLIYFWFSFPFSPDVAKWHTLRLLSVHIFIFYINTKWLLPGFFARNKYWIYFLLVILLLILIYYIFIYTQPFMPYDRLVQQGRPHGIRIRLSRWILPNLGWSFLILFFSTIFWVTDQFRMKKAQETLLRNEQLSTEMKLLKSQINPHFLFNALNNIYSYSLKESRQTPDMILKLSDMLRYVLYESNVDRVLLIKEMVYVQNYIDFQLIKFESSPNLTLLFPDNLPEVHIAPMLLIPFVENGFKHANLEDKENGWLKISLKVKDKMLIFESENSISRLAATKDQTHGIGIANVTKRLELIYPETHSLVVKQSDTTFHVYLTIDIS